MAIVFGVICVLLIVYLVCLQRQLRNINRQLGERLTTPKRQPISLEFLNLNSQLNRLTININKYLKEEENRRLDSIRGEKHFKELIANISHDLRTPLTAIKGYQQLMEKGMLTDDQHHKLQIAQKHAVRLEHLIEQFFEYSYRVSSEPVLHIERINLTNLVSECLAQSVSVFEEHDLTVQLEETTPVFACVDKELTIRIIQNLIRNCTLHSAGAIEVSLLSDNNAVMTFTNPVKNNAVIDVSKLFDRFYTADKSRGNSTGLGLSIVKLLAEQMDGSVSAALTDGSLTIQVKLALCKES